MARPLSFDPDKALDKAMRVFWKRGYEGASMPELTKAMGINKPSLYAAFGNKEQLYRKVLQRYEQGPSAYAVEALQAPTAHEMARKLLIGAIEVSTCPKNPGGCLLLKGTMTCGKESPALRRAVIGRRDAYETAVRDRFQRAIDEGDLPRDADAADLARFITTVTHGLGVQASTGRSREELLPVAEAALKAIPPNRRGK